MVNGKQELQETLEEWNGLFTRRGLKLNLENTEVMHRPSEGRARRRTGGEETDSGGQFRVPRRGSMWRRKVGERGRAYIEEYIQLGRSANAWRAVEGVMVDRRISKKSKGQSHERLCYTGMPVRN